MASSWNSFDLRIAPPDDNEERNFRESIPPSSSEENSDAGYVDC